MAGVAAGVAGDRAQTLALLASSRTSLTSVQARLSAAGPRKSGRQATTSHDA